MNATCWHNISPNIVGIVLADVMHDVGWGCSNDHNMLGNVACMMISTAGESGFDILLYSMQPAGWTIWPLRGRVEELVSARFFFLLASGADKFFRAAHVFFFIAISCMHMISFLTVKALQEFFSQIFHSPPPPSKIKWSTPKWPAVKLFPIRVILEIYEYLIYQLKVCFVYQESPSTDFYWL